MHAHNYVHTWNTMQQCVFVVETVAQNVASGEELPELALNINS